MEDIYEKLRQYFNEWGTTKLPKTKEGMELLQLLLTQEQAEYALNLPGSVKGRISLGDLAKKMNKGVQEVEEKVDAMARAGLVLASTSRKDGTKYYAMWNVMPGMMESTYADGEDSDKRRKLSRLWKKYFDDAYWSHAANSDYPLFRIIPIQEKAISRGDKVLHWEDSRSLIENADVITVIPCHCRSVMKNCDHILEADFVFGAWAKYLIDYRGAREFTKEEALQRLQECRDDGLIQLSGNVQEGTSVICNCCPCCCGALRGFLELHNERSAARANYEPRVDHETCSLCKKCQKICPMEAIQKVAGLEPDGSDTRMVLESPQCIGCGLCAEHCPEEAISMKKVRDDLPARTLMEMAERYEKEKVW